MSDKPLNLYQSLGKSLEDYIEVVYDLHQEKGEARISDISTRLSLAKPSVNAAIKKLVSLGLVKHELYGGVDLTDEGKALAGNVRHKHNILLRFLENILGVDHDVAENEACLLEHSISDDTMSKLESFIESVRPQ